MSSIHVCQGTKNLCYSCNKPGNPLRTCGKCKIARYCSTACQKSNWEVHKQTCRDHRAEFSTNIKDELKVFLKWGDAWRDPLLVWASFAADLANQPADFLLTHSYLLVIENQPSSDNLPARCRYQVVSAGMRDDSEIIGILQTIPDAAYREQNIEGFHYYTPKRNLLRYTIKTRTHFYHTGANTIHNIFKGEEKAWIDSSRAESRVLSTRLRAAWSTKFPDHLCTGDTSGHINVLQNLKMIVSDMSGVALDVD
ncbi:hypothetical protein C8R43DRAFT_706866 [Mycena crocata]|nr:hypothetical protein C8R43DRAFT_706866 [Mycena crocata]